ncbi:hypothetical protein AgCh_011905 [Apium graveolens]
MNSKKNCLDFDVSNEVQENLQLHVEPRNSLEEQELHGPEEIESETENAKKRHFNVVFIGHVDTGKSTIGGQILFLSGQVDERTIQRYMAYIMDTNEEERTRGHKSYVPNMISGAYQADIGVLVISARKGEFETGFEKGGQTREHVQLAKTLGVTKLLVVVNKMDDPTVNWSIERYNEIESKMTPFLKISGYNVKKDVQFLPISGLQGSNLQTRVNKDVCSWWNGACLFEALDAINIPPCDPNTPFRLPIMDRFKEMGTVVMGKSESGSAHVKVLAIYCDEDKVRRAGPGENLRVRLSGMEEEDTLSGFVLCSVARPIPAVTSFVAPLQFLEVLDNAIYTAGYKAVLHIHSVVEECEIVELMKKIDMKTGKPLKKKVHFVKNGAVVLCRIQLSRNYPAFKWTLK